MDARVTDNPKQACGDEKPRLHLTPMSPMLDVAAVMASGAAKYGVKNWRKQPIKASTYYSAMMRHLIAWFEEAEDNDPESGHRHLAHVIANALIVMDAEGQGVLIDDRDFSEALGK